MNAELSQKVDGCTSPHEICFAIWISKNKKSDCQCCVKLVFLLPLVSLCLFPFNPGMVESPSLGNVVVPVPAEGMQS